MFKLKKELIGVLKSIEISLSGIENKLVQLVNNTSGIESRINQIDMSISNISQAFTNISVNPSIALDVRDISKI